MKNDEYWEMYKQQAIVDNSYDVLNDIYEREEGGDKAGNNMDDELKKFISRDDVHEEGNKNYPIWNSPNTNPKFVKGAYIIGKLVQKRTKVGKDKKNVYVIKKSDGEIVSVWGTSLIDKRLSNKEVGQELAIVYNGKRTSQGSGREYHDFRFYFKEPVKRTEAVQKKITEEEVFDQEIEEIDKFMNEIDE